MSLAHGPKTSANGLVLCLDASNTKSYPGSGNTWFDASGNGNHFTLYNSPVWDGTSMSFSTTGSKYARSTNTFNLSYTNAITVECIYKVASVADNKMIFEHTADWNTNGGAFGAFTNSNGGLDAQPSTNNDLHMNSAVGRLDSGPCSDLTVYSMSQWTFVQGEGVRHFNNGIAPAVINNVVSAGSNFANAYTYIAVRGGTNFHDGTLNTIMLKVYDRKLTDAELQQNYKVFKNRFGI